MRLLSPFNIQLIIMTTTGSSHIRNENLLNLLFYFIVLSLFSSVTKIWAQNQTEKIFDTTDESNKTTIFSHSLENLEVGQNLSSSDNSSSNKDSNLVKGRTEEKEVVHEKIITINYNNNDNNNDDGVLHDSSDNINSKSEKYSDNLHRTVNKCCPFNQRYENNSCVDMEKGDNENMMMRMMVNTSEHSMPLPLWKPGFENSTLEDSVVFKLNISMPECDVSDRIEKIIHKDKVGHTHNSLLHGTLESSSLVLSTYGYLIWQDVSGYMNTLPYKDFCMDQINETAFIALLCKPACNEKKPCFRKCCGPDSILGFDGEYFTCLVSKSQWSLHLYTLNGTPILDDPYTQPRYTYGLPKCSNHYSISSNEEYTDNLYTLVNGSLVSIIKGKTIVYPPDIYCMDDVVNTGGNGSEEIKGTISSNEFVHLYGGSNELDRTAILCFPENLNGENTNEEPLWKYTVTTIAAFSSVLFLGLTAIVYLILWEHQNIHGWLQFAYVVSCLQSYLFLGILQLAPQAIHSYDTNLCEVMGSVTHFSFLSTFFWLTSMNFDLWFTFSGCRPLRARSRVGEIRRFCFFALFSWGSAGIIAGTGLTLDLVYKHSSDSTIIRPRFGEKKCYFFGDEEQLPYLYGPMGFLLIIDLIFFLNTIYSLHKLQQDTRFATQQSSRQDKKRFILFVKLFFVMGVLWIFEVLSWAALVYDPENRRTWDVIFVVFDVINASQGLLIFIIFTCKPNTCRQLEGQLKKFTIFLQEKRDRGVGPSIINKIKDCITIGFITLIIPIVHLFRNIFSFCGQRNRSMVGNRHTTTMTSTFDKFRKASDTSTTTTNLSIKEPDSLITKCQRYGKFDIRNILVCFLDKV